MRHIETFTCVNCGVKFESRIKDAKFCSKQCSNQRGAKIRSNSLSQCPNNRWVVCDTQKCDCETCGWNPEVSQRRMDKLLGKECTA